MTTRRRLLELTAAALATPALSRSTFAQGTYPSRFIRAIIPFSAGSTMDIVGRIVLDPLAARLGQTNVVENRGGAGGSLGSSVVSKSDPDGYTILVNGAGHAAAAAAFPNINYDPAADFAGVVLFGAIANVLVVAPSLGVRTLQESVVLAKTGDMTCSSAGVGSATHWAAERFRVSAGIKATHIPFRGGPEGLTEVMAGRIAFTCMGAASTLPFVTDGKLLPLAVSTPQRSALMPNVPTTLEAGYRDSDYTFWMGIFVPAKTPRPIVDKLRAETMKVLEEPNVVANFKLQGIEPLPLTSAEIDAMVKKEVVANRALAKAAGLRFD